MIDADRLNEFRVIYPEAKEMSEAGFDYVHIPLLVMPQGNTPAENEALLCPQMRDGYITRLFFLLPIPGKGDNWTQHHILGRTWHSCSWQNVQQEQSLVQILLGHLEAFR